MIRVSRLRKTFGSTVAVNDISFEVKEGEVVGLLGPNGAGKSTTMRMLTTFLDPDAGEIEIAGYDALDQPIEARRRIGYLPESAPLYEELGVLESLHYTAKIRGLDAATRNRRVDEMVEACGLGSVTHKFIGQLSKGYRQRVGLAQSIVHDPAFLILDEPTTGLDPNQIKEIRALITKLGAKKTIILSTHIMQEVQAVCSRALIINKGTIVADGRPDQLVTQSSTKGCRFSLTVRGAVRERATAAFSKADGVRSVVVEGEVGDLLHLTAVGANDGVADELFRTAVREQWVLRELRLERASLEDVFTQLTIGATGNAGTKKENDA
ncbi:MAG: ATP-binding cassette domain-containing protein [Planctomycetes bacterium]|nr:ATP-binding cassette domain-containing protein [Planctomycetota bacterium]